MAGSYARANKSQTSPAKKPIAAPAIGATEPNDSGKAQPITAPSSVQGIVGRNQFRRCFIASFYPPNGYTAGMIGDDWILGWIVDGLAKRFGPAKVSGWIALGALLVLVVFACTR